MQADGIKHKFGILLRGFFVQVLGQIQFLVIRDRTGYFPSSGRKALKHDNKLLWQCPKVFLYRRTDVIVTGRAAPVFYFYWLQHIFNAFAHVLTKANIKH